MNITNNNKFSGIDNIIIPDINKLILQTSNSLHEIWDKMGINLKILIIQEIYHILKEELKFRIWLINYLQYFQLF